MEGTRPFLSVIKGPRGLPAEPRNPYNPRVKKPFEGILECLISELAGSRRGVPGAYVGQSVTLGRRQ